MGNQIPFPTIPTSWHVGKCGRYSRFCAYARSRSAVPARKWCRRHLLHHLADPSEIFAEVKRYNTQLVKGIWTKSVDIDFIVCWFGVEWPNIMYVIYACYLITLCATFTHVALWRCTLQLLMLRYNAMLQLLMLHYNAVSYDCSWYIITLNVAVAPVTL